MTKILYGRPVVDAVERQLAPRIAVLREKGTVPAMALLRVGDATEQISYERSLQKRFRETGMELIRRVLPADCGMDALLACLDGINADGEIHGCLLLRPLPKSLDEHTVCQRLLPGKDVDGMTDASLTALLTGQGTGFRPSTAEACLRMLDYYGVSIEGAHIVVIGRSLVVGKPLALSLCARNATVTLCHSRSRELAGQCRRADILISTAGSAELVRKEFVRSGQTVIDVGINGRADGTVCGDVAFDEVSQSVDAISPVPGGLGPVAAAVLMEHVVLAAERQCGRAQGK